MKKIFITVILMSVFCSNSFAADYYAVGVDAFKKGVYDKAAANFEHSIKINPENVNARYYLAQTYLMQNRITDAKEQYNRILVIAPASDASRLSAKGLSLICQSYKKNNSFILSGDLDKYKDNYFDYVLSDGNGIKKWASFPINVYIEPKKQKAPAQKAFEQWQAKSNGLVSFNFVNSPEKAKITVDFKDKLESTSTKESFIAGYSTPVYEGAHILKSQIHILAADPDTKQEFDDNFILATTLHELGHSLGFVGHSPNPNDVMAATSDSPKVELSVRDINTLNVFYRIDNKTFLARQSGQTDVKLQQALDYVKKQPDKSVGWANLGDIYYSKKMYKESIINYQKAISIEPDKANLYNSIGVVYRVSSDKQNAYVSFKKACDLDKSNIFYLTQFSAICSETGHKDVAKNYVAIYLKANPQNSSDEKIKKLVNELN